ncbi:MAG: D-glycero-beta-D-manno-heptose-7-phosphate kinase [Candidatus Omnitrophica bacterium]|nr:D-glycero-beta-D-manno-heptose-7-phosphate kinase [Candidatus Omnitrophota bacterium]
MNDFNKIIACFKNKRILVVGDVILDQYITGTVSRISPEAPVPIVKQEGHPRYTPGGSANVASNLSALGAKVFLVGKVGQDREEKILKKELRKRKIDITGLFVDKHIPTAIKTRIIAQHQQLVRVDREDVTFCGSDGGANKILHFIEKKINDIDAVIISDYGKGVITKALVTKVCVLARKNKKIITVDPKVEHFNFYNKVTCITPNKKEVENAIRDIIITHYKGRSLKIKADKLTSLKDVRMAGVEILSYLNLESLLITLGEEGMCLFEENKEPFLIPTKAKEVFDVSGAGDTVISVLTLSLTAGATKQQAALLANYAAGVVVGKTGAVAIKPAEILAAINEVN